MSSRARLRHARPSRLLTLAFLGVLGGTVLLGLLGFSASRRVGELTRESVHVSTEVLADKIVRKVEKRIIDQDRVLFELVDLKDLNDFKVFWNRLTTMSSLVEGALVLDHDYRILHYSSKERPREQRRFTALFSRQILPRLELRDLPTGYHKHLHVALDGRDYLISYMRLRQRGEPFLVALKINLDYLQTWMLKEELSGLAPRYVAAVVDQDGRRIYGTLPSGRLAEHQVTRRFTATLYRWRLVLAPRAAVRLATHTARRDRITLVLFLASLATTLLGLGGLLWALRREQLVAKLKGEFVSTVTHEIKTPLSLIRMYGELLAVSRPDAAAKRSEYAAVLSREIDRLSRLVDNVLDLSRLEHGLRAAAVTRLDVVSLVAEVVDAFAASAERARVTLRLQTLPGDTPESTADTPASRDPILAEIDPDGVRLALFNLVDNAVKYGGGAVTVRVEGDPRWVRIHVIDNGPGIPREEQERLFDRFYRGRRALRGRQRGSGIGLSLVRLVAEAHHGAVTVSSDASERGTCFTLSLPRRARPRRRPWRALWRRLRRTRSSRAVPAPWTQPPPPEDLAP